MAYEYSNKQLGYFGQGISQADVLNLVSGAVSTAANVGLQVYAQKEAAKAAKRQEKIDAMLAAQQAANQVYIPQAPSGNSTLMIGAIAGGAVLLGLLVFVLTRNKGSDSPQGSGGTQTAAPTSYAPAAPAPPPRRIKKIKRVSRPKRAH